MRRVIMVILLVILMGCQSEEMNVNKDEIYANDYVSSASTVYQYMDYYVKGNELIKAINSKEGVCVFATLNTDGTSNTAIFTMEMVDSKYMIVHFIGENQTLRNLQNKPQGMITYLQYKKDVNQVFNYIGAKIIVDFLFLKDDISSFEISYERELQGAEYLLRIVEIRPLG